MDHYYLPADMWQTLYEMMAEDGYGQAFDDFFDDPVNGYSHLTGDNLQAYEAWLQQVLGTNNPDDYADFISWDPNFNLQSGQNPGGFKILP